MSIDLDSQEVKDAIAAAVEEATSGLKAKNAELLGKLKKAQQGSSIDPAELQAVEQERDQLKAALDKANKDLKKAATDLESLNKRAEAAEGFASRLLIDNGLTEALVKAGVTNPIHQKAARAMLKEAGITLATEGDNRIPKVGDKVLADYVKEWAAGDEGKHFVTATDANGGGAANGSGRTTQTKPNATLGGTKEERRAAIEARLKSIDLTE